MNKREIILAVIEDMVADFIYYDRKEDEALKRGDIERAIKSGKISVDEIVDHFRKKLEDSI